MTKKGSQLFKEIQEEGGKIKDLVNTKFKPLSPKMRKFCEEYVFDRNGPEAARRAGYNPKTARQRAWQLLRLPEVEAEIAHLIRGGTKHTGITKERWVAEMVKIGLANIQDYADIIENGASVRDIGRDQAAAISQYEVEVIDGKVQVRKAKIKLADKRAALVDLGKYLGYYKDEVNHKVTLSLEQIVNQSFIEGEVVEVPALTPPDE